MRITKDKFINRGKLKHGDIYDYSLVNYINSHTKIDIICKTHGVFSQRPYSHLNGHGCAECSVIKVHNNQKKKIKDFILEANSIHNNKYDYKESIYINNKSKIKIYCISHKTFFLQSPKKHLSGQSSCKLCNKISIGERLIINWLKNNNHEYETEKSFKNCRLGKTSLMRYDFFLPSKKMLIEFDGEQHFKPMRRYSDKLKQIDELNKIKTRDEFKNVWANQNNYKLLRIPYTEIDNIDKILLLELGLP